MAEHRVFASFLIEADSHDAAVKRAQDCLGRGLQETNEDGSILAAGANAPATKRLVSIEREILENTCYATLADGTMVNLTKIQASLVSAFQETGDSEYSAAADDLSLLTGVVMGAHGEWLPAPTPAKPQRDR